MTTGILACAWAFAAVAVIFVYWLTHRMTYELCWERRAVYWQLTAGRGQVRVYRQRRLRELVESPRGVFARAERRGYFYLKARSPMDRWYLGFGNFCLACGKHTDRRYCVASVPVWFPPLLLLGCLLTAL
jgi:hypothetical protein